MQDQKFRKFEKKKKKKDVINNLNLLNPERMRNITWKTKAYAYAKGCFNIHM